MSHVAALLRRTDGTFAPILDGGEVRPREEVRYFTSGVQYATIHAPEFVVLDQHNLEVFSFIAGVTIGGDAWVDTAAPEREGLYTLVVHAQSFPFLPFTHESRVGFGVSRLAPPPPPPPPGGIGGMVKALTVLSLVVVGGVVAMQLLPRLRKSSS